MSSKRRDAKRDLDQRQALWDHYGDRVVRSGKLAPQTDYSRFYCFECKNHFLQRVAELVQMRSTRKKPANTRCMCPPMDPSKRFRDGDHSKTKGHMCLPEWDQWDLAVPERPKKRPEKDT